MNAIIVSYGLVLLLCGSMQHATSKKTREKSEVNIRYMNKKLKNVMKEVEVLTLQVAKLNEALGTFSDELPCPNNVDGFYLKESMGSCYHLEPMSVMLNWTDAQALCRSYHDDAHLVSIETEEEQKFLQRKWQNERGIATVSRFWTDGIFVTDRWIWDHINDSTSYGNWIPTTTRDDERFACLAVYSNEGYFWGDVACWAPHMVTCEINI